MKTFINDDLVGFLSEKFANFHQVHAEWAGMPNHNPKNMADIAFLLLMLATDDSPKLYRKQTGDLVSLLTERLTNFRPAGELKTDIRELQSVEICSDYVRLKYTDVESFAGSLPADDVVNITRLSGDFWRELFLSM